MTHLRSLLYDAPSQAEEVAERARSVGGVSSVVWLLTYRCNLNCLHCYQGGRPSEELTTGDCLRIIDKLEKAGKPLIFVSGGEPMIREDTLSLLEEMKGRGFRVVLSTNGTLIDESNAGRLSESVDNIALPVYGPENFHDSLTQVSGSHSKVMRSLSMIKGSTGLTLKTVVSRSTLRYLDYLLELAFKYDVTKLYFCDLLPKRGMEGELLGRTEWMELVDKLLQVISERDVEIDLGLHPSAAVYAAMKLGYSTSGIRRKLDGRRLSREGMGFISLAPNGDVLVSSYAPELKVGNLVKGDVADVLSNDLYSKLGSGAIRGSCSKCPLRDVCGGSRVKAYLYSGDVLGEDPTCLVRDLLA